MCDYMPNSDYADYNRGGRYTDYNNTEMMLERMIESGGDLMKISEF